MQPADLTLQSKQPVSFELLMKHLFEWRWVFGFWSSCRPHSDRNRLSLHKVLSDKLWECEAPTCVWSALLLWERNKAFLFFNTSVYAEETALRLNTFIHIFHTSILVATDRVKAMWLTGRCDIQLNLFVTITIPLLSFLLLEWTYYDLHSLVLELSKLSWWLETGDVNC